MNKLQSTLTRKAGPLPVWVWGVLALAVTWFFFFRAPKAAGGTQLPYTPQGSRSAAQQPASGQGSASENANAALLAALAQNDAAQDSLLAAVQQPQSAAAGSTPEPTLFLSAPTVEQGSPAAASSPTTFPTTQPAGTYFGDAIVQTAVGPVSYSGYTQNPAAVDASGGYVNGIIPAVTYTVGQGGSVDPILESIAVATHINTPAYSPDPNNVQNAVAQASKTGKPVAI